MTDRPAKRSSTPTAEMHHRWYLPEWCTLHGKRQADLERDLGWPRAKTSMLWNGKQRYTQEQIDEVSIYLGVEPYELLMPPDEAVGLRQLRDAARSIVANSPGASDNDDRRPRVR
jgi:transcriptional regulator with XRE-family HTH domain